MNRLASTRSQPMRLVIPLAVACFSACQSEPDKPTDASAAGAGMSASSGNGVGGAGGSAGAQAGTAGNTANGGASNGGASSGTGEQGGSSSGGRQADGGAGGVAGTGGAGPGGAGAGGQSDGGSAQAGSSSAAGGVAGVSGATGESGQTSSAGTGGVVPPDNLPDDDGIGHFHHVHINSVDPDASIAFYTEWFVSEAAELGGAPALWTQASWVLFDKVQAAAPSPVISSIYHIGWTVSGMQARYDAMVQAGVPFDTPITNTSEVFGGTGGADFAYAAGPDGELIEFYQGNPAQFVHLHFVSDDPVGAGEWYKEHFAAVRNQPSPDRTPGVVNGKQIRPYMSVTIDAISVYWYPRGFAEASYPDAWTGRTQFAPQRGRVIDHFALSVENLWQALDRLEAEGVQILEPPTQRMNGAFVSAFVQAPDQVELELVQGPATRP